MIVAKAYRVHIYPTDEQKRIIDNTFNGMRFVRNQIISYKCESFKRSNGEQIVDVCLDELIDMHQWLKSVPKHILYQSQKKVNSEFIKFVHRPTKHRSPKYYSKFANVPMTYEDYSFKYVLFRDNDYREHTRQVNLPRIGYVDMHKSPEMNIQKFLDTNNLSPGIDFCLSHIKITRSAAGKYFATFIFMYDNKISEYDKLQLRWGRKRTTCDNAVGINDIKCNTDRSDVLCMDSNHNCYPVWKTLLNLYTHIKVAIDIVSRKTVGSTRFYKMLQRLSILTERMECLERNYIHAITNGYATRYETCFLLDEQCFRKNMKFFRLKKMLRKYMRIKFYQRGSDIIELRHIKTHNIDIEYSLFMSGCQLLNI